MMPEKAERLLEQLRPYARDEEAFGRLHADFHDLIEICAWFLAATDSRGEKQLSPDEIESFLIELDVQRIHANHHLRSLKKDLGAILGKFPDAEGGEETFRGVA